MRRAWMAMAAALMLGAAPGAFAQTKGVPPPPVVKPGPPGPHVEDPGKLPEAPPTVPDLAYDSRLLSSAASAEQFQGALDGGWTLAGRKGDLYAFQLVDKRDALEGAWRDLRKSQEPAASGVLDEIRRTPAGLLIRFTPAGQLPVSVRIRPNLKGELEQAGKRVPVTLRRQPKTVP